MPHTVSGVIVSEPPEPPSFGEWLKRRRKLLDLTQEELAKRSGCARVTIHKLEADDMRPSKQLAILLAQALEIPVGEREAFVQLARGGQRTEETPSPEPEAADTSLYRRTFVGREVELRQAQAAFDAALTGRGSLLMVVGEPGIGKTVLCERLALYAAQHGGRALVGHCYEEGSLSIPYLPFIEAMSGYVLAREPNLLRRELGAGAADLARIVPQVRERLGVELRADSGPGSAEDRYHLLKAVTNFLRRAGAAQPLLIVLEDLHWADRGTLDMLLHMARKLAGAWLLIAGTYRDVEVDRAHPLSSAMADLRRAGAFGRILLRGFGTDDVQRMMSRIAGQEVTMGLAEAVHRQTEGNPLFVEEVIRYLGEAGLIVRDANSGQWRRVGETPLAMQIPEGLRDVIGKRLSRLSPTCNRVLAVAAVIGRDFALDVLQQVSGLSEDEVFAALEEAQRTAIVEERGSPGAVLVYRFTHALFRQTLYEETFTPRRLRLHQQVARALEAQYASRLGEHAAQLAEHFAQSSDAADLAKAVEYGALAAQRAMSVYAYGEAVRLLEQALQVQDVLDSDGQLKRCDLLLALGEALIAAGEPKRVADTAAPEAFALADALTDRLRCGRACHLAIEALANYGAQRILSSPSFWQWADRAIQYSEPGTIERAFADRALAYSYDTKDEYAKAWEHGSNALSKARELSDPAPFVCMATWLLSMERAPQHQGLQRQVAEEVLGLPPAAFGPSGYGYLLRVAGRTFLEFAQRERAEEAWRELDGLAARTQRANTLLMPYTTRAWLLTLDGDFEAAVEAGAQMIVKANELGSPVMGTQYAALATQRARIHLGRAAEALAALPLADPAAGLIDTRARWPDRASLLAHLGRRPEAREALDKIVNYELEDTRAGFVSTAWLVIFLETALLVEDRSLAATLCTKLTAVEASIDGHSLTIIARHLAAASAFLGDKLKAADYNRQALAIATRVRFRPEIALVRLQMAELLLDDTVAAKRAEAQAHLEFAIGEFRAMKMEPALKRALRHKS